MSNIKDTATIQMLLHSIPPVFNRNSKILILGSFPSVKSRENDIEPILYNRLKK